VVSLLFPTRALSRGARFLVDVRRAIFSNLPSFMEFRRQIARLEGGEKPRAGRDRSNSLRGALTGGVRAVLISILAAAPAANTRVENGLFPIAALSIGCNNWRRDAAVFCPFSGLLAARFFRN
jgi:hypothetical protein